MSYPHVMDNGASRHNSDSMHSAVQQLVSLFKEFPDLNQVIDAMVYSPQNPRDEFPDHYLLPHHAWTAISTHMLKISPEEFRSEKHGAQVDRIRMLGAWSKTKSIYRFDPDVYQELMNTPLKGELSNELLSRLPDWCMYLETPGLLLQGKALQGVWVMSDYRLGTSPASIICIRPDLGPSHPVNSIIRAIVIPLGEGTLEEELERYTESGRRELPGLVDEVEEAVADSMRFAAQVLSLVLYICTQRDARDKLGQPAIRDTLPGSASTLPLPQKTKKGLRLFQPSQPQVWDIGIRMGNAIRRALNQTTGSTGTAGSVRPHMRAAHWHTFRVGKIKDEEGNLIPAVKRSLTVKWLPSVPVNVNDDEPLPAVIRPVR